MGGMKLKDMSFNEMIFLVEILNIARSKGFKFKSEDGVLYVKYPLYSNEKESVIKNFKEVANLCDDILQWK